MVRDKLLRENLASIPRPYYRLSEHLSTHSEARRPQHQQPVCQGHAGRGEQTGSQPFTQGSVGLMRQSREAEGRAGLAEAKLDRNATHVSREALWCAVSGGRLSFPFEERIPSIKKQKKGGVMVTTDTRSCRVSKRMVQVADEGLDELNESASPGARDDI